VMISDGTKALGVELPSRDIAELVAESLS